MKKRKLLVTLGSTLALGLALVSCGFTQPGDEGYEEKLKTIDLSAFEDSYWQANTNKGGDWTGGTKTYTVSSSADAKLSTPAYYPIKDAAGNELDADNIKGLESVEYKFYNRSETQSFTGFKRQSPVDAPTLAGEYWVEATFNVDESRYAPIDPWIAKVNIYHETIYTSADFTWEPFTFEDNGLAHTQVAAHLKLKKTVDGQEVEEDIELTDDTRENKATIAKDILGVSNYEYTYYRGSKAEGTPISSSDLKDLGKYTVQLELKSKDFYQLPKLRETDTTLGKTTCEVTIVPEGQGPAVQSDTFDEDISIVFNNGTAANNYANVEKLNKALFNTFQIKDNTVGFTGSLSFKVKAGTLVTINGYSGYVNYNVNGEKAATVRTIYVTEAMAGANNEYTITIDTGTTQSYINSIAIDVDGTAPAAATTSEINISGGTKTFEVNDTFTKGDLKVLATDSLGKITDVTDTATVTFANGVLDANNKFTASGTYTATVTYDGKTKTYEVVVGTVDLSIKQDTAVVFKSGSYSGDISNPINFGVTADSKGGFTVTGSTFTNTSYLEFKGDDKVAFAVTVPSGKKAVLTIKYYQTVDSNHDNADALSVIKLGETTIAKNEAAAVANHLYTYDITASGDVTINATTVQNYLEYITVTFVDSNSHTTVSTFAWSNIDVADLSENEVYYSDDDPEHTSADYIVTQKRYDQAAVSTEVLRSAFTSTLDGEASTTVVPIVSAGAGTLQYRDGLKSSDTNPLYYSKLTNNKRTAANNPQALVIKNEGLVFTFTGTGTIVLTVAAGGDSARTLSLNNGTENITPVVNGAGYVVTPDKEVTNHNGTSGVKTSVEITYTITEAGTYKLNASNEYRVTGIVITQTASE